MGRFCEKYKERIISYTVCLILMMSILVFELGIVAPAIFTSKAWLIFHYVLAAFFILNINGNLIKCTLTDTSINAARSSHYLKSTINDTVMSCYCGDPTGTELKDWHFCRLCNCWTPPRAWHCNYCHICILRRDHHCFFTGGCIGHANLRYFLMCLLHTAIATCYALFLNIYYFFHLNASIYRNFFTLIKLLAPLSLIYDYSLHSLWLFLFLLNIMLATFSSIVLCLQLYWVTVVGGSPTDPNRSSYNYGARRNLELVLGRRMSLVWLSPYIQSDLQHDGLHWQPLAKEQSSNAM